MYFDFRFSIFGTLAFLCSNLYYSKRAHSMFAVKMLNFTHQRKKTLAQFEYRNTGYYMHLDFRFSVFGHLAFFVLEVVLYSKRAHCEYHVCSEDAHLHPSTKEKLSKI